MILDATTKTIEFFLDGAPATNQLPASVSYVDYTTTTLAPAASDTISNSTTAVTLVAAPGASTQRQVKAIHIYNADTAPRTVTVRLNNNAILRIMVQASLAVGDSLVYEWGRGWFRVPNASTVESGFFGNGSAAAPSITFTLDPDTGLYRPAANQLGITAAGAQVVQVDAAQLGLASGLVARMLSQNRFRYLQSMARVTFAVAQVIPDSTWTAVAWLVETFDTDALHDAGANTRLTAQIAGKYAIIVNGMWAGNATGQRQLEVNLNGVRVFLTSLPATTTNVVVSAITETMILAVADYLEVRVWQNSGGNLNFVGTDGGAMPSFSMVYIGE